ncbi:hypothetical protein LTS14_005775 [Recurvomyces mirabilis]|uniref:uncharacterized protein n=1 Tax=Recurvomyces mirabilis TaxID=574656 RepID=UPI002DE04DDA|nr:hypothetical protein LTS14_005775 [Recurvomyces mirabilis]
MASITASPGLIFINVGHDGNEDPVAARKAIRSYATAHSHKSKPRTGQRLARYKPLQYDKDEPAPARKERKPSRPRRSSVRSITSVGVKSVSSASSSSSSQNENVRKRRRLETDDSGEVFDMSRLLLAPETIPKSPSAELAPTLPSSQHSTPGWSRQSSVDHTTSECSHASAPPHKTPALYDEPYFTETITPACLQILQKEPFTRCPVPFQEWYTPLLHDWCNITIARTCILLDFRPSETREYIQWMGTTLLSDPALYYTSLFLATGSAVVRGTCDISKALFLRGQAVKAINDALTDPLRATSMQTIFAVGQVALHEHMYGDRHLSIKFHRPAQERELNRLLLIESSMIALRGGLGNLGLPTVALRTLLWFDTYMAAESGTPAYFADVPARFAHCGIPPLSPEEAVRVADGVSPLRRSHPGYGDSRVEEAV